MFSSKQDIDRHVKINISKLSEAEVRRNFTFKIFVAIMSCQASRWFVFQCQFFGRRTACRPSRVYVLSEWWKSLRNFVPVWWKFGFSIKFHNVCQGRCSVYRSEFRLALATYVQRIDNHLFLSSSHVQRKNKGYTIAKYYFKIGEYPSAETWLLSYLDVRSEHPPALRLLGQCYERQKKPEKALQYYQRSLQIDPKQPTLINDGKEYLLLHLLPTNWRSFFSQCVSFCCLMTT